MAGLPKPVFVLIFTLALAATLTIVALGQVTQPSSIDLQTVFDLLDANALIDPVILTSLKSDFETAVTLGVLSPEQALDMLELVQWETLDEVAALAGVSAAIQTILADLSSGVLAEGDPLALLAELLDGLDTPSGTLNAIGKTGVSEEILDQVSGLVADGVPPGILVRIVKQGVANGLTTEEITAQLDLLTTAMAEESGDIAWGQIVNDILGKGENKHRDQEQNMNIDGNEEPEQEENEHGNSHGKKDDNPGQGQTKGKGKDK